ncbi:MAG: Mfa1 fimbrilin C-terminal domain-containing protein [Alistipes sp.]|nr:Mfa1 fimbrilin C-terminal domain-containing protein [Alistipes sp.]
MKKYLFIALALLGMASCAKDDLNAGNKPHHNGEVEESYIAINLMAADVDSRAQDTTNPKDGGYEDGTDAERAVKRAYFFFFDENGSPFNLLGAPATAPGGTKNYLQLNITPMQKEGGEDVNVSDISQAVLVLQTYKGIHPKQVVAVLNWTPDDRAYTLADLQNIVEENSLGNDANGYVMSNSVYLNGENIMVATPIAEGNIKTTADDAKAAPVEIYVERTAAKVVVTTTAADNRFEVATESEFTPVDDVARKVYVELLGWELYNEFDKTNIIKSIENWDVNVLGLTWNDSPYFRSYWAETMNVRTTNDTFAWSYATANGLPTEYGYKVAADASYAAGTYAYCGENTLDWTTNDVRTKVILKGRLVEQDGEGYKTLELARWYGNEYAGEDDLKTAVANSLAYTVFYDNPAYDSNNPESPKYLSITPDHIQVVHGETIGKAAYEVGFQLTNAAQGLTWYKYSSAGGHQIFGDSGVAGDNAIKTNAHLATVEPAVLYESGDTYYIVDIEHLGKDKNKTAYYGVVRNHVYQIDIQSIKGYGSPGYSGFAHVVEKPEYPKDDDKESYVAARINVLSWKVVKQGVNIEQ